MFEDDEIKGLLRFVPWWAKLSPSTEEEEESGEFGTSFHYHYFSIVGWLLLRRQIINLRFSKV